MLVRALEQLLALIRSVEERAGSRAKPGGGPTVPCLRAPSGARDARLPRSHSPPQSEGDGVRPGGNQLQLWNKPFLFGFRWKIFIYVAGLSDVFFADM